MVAYGDREDFLPFLRMGHFRRKCPMRKNGKRDAAEALPLPARGYCPTVIHALERTRVHENGLPLPYFQGSIDSRKRMGPGSLPF